MQFDRPTAEAWLAAGMAPMMDLLLAALTTRAQWVGVDLGPGWPSGPLREPLTPEQMAEAAKVIAADSAEAERAVLEQAMKAAGVAQPQQKQSPGAGAVQPHQDLTVHVPDVEELQAAAVAELAGATSEYINILAQVLPGSELHTQLSARLLSLVRRNLGTADRTTREVASSAYDAFVLRYGKLDEETFERLAAGALKSLDLLEAAQEQSQQQEEEEEEGEQSKARREREREENRRQAQLYDKLFAEDVRIRTAAAQAKARAEAAAEAGRREEAARRRKQKRRAAAEAEAAAAAAAAAAAKEEEEEEEEEEPQLPEGVAAARVGVTAVGGGGAAGAKDPRAAVLDEAEEELQRILSEVGGARGKGKRQAAAGGGARRVRGLAGAGGVGEEQEEEEDVWAAAARRAEGSSSRGVNEEELLARLLTPDNGAAAAVGVGMPAAAAAAGADGGDGRTGRVSKKRSKAEPVRTKGRAKKGSGEAAEGVQPAAGAAADGGPAAGGLPAGLLDVFPELSAAPPEPEPGTAGKAKSSRKGKK